MKRKNLDDYGGSCIIENVKGKRAEDYDTFDNEYNQFTIERL